METILRIEGMHCEHCRLTIAQALMAIPGVTKAEVSLEARKAVVTHDDSIHPLEFVKTIQGQGYTASVG